MTLLICAQAPAQRSRSDERTGTRLGSKAVRSSVMQLNPGAEIQEIERLLAVGDDEQAVELAREYAASFEGRVTYNEPSPSGERYFALNALCVALTKTREYDEAVAVCTRAIELIPNRWIAVNNRGTAYYASQRYAEALADYRRARVLVADEDDAIETIEHNIALCEAQLTDA